MKPVLAGLSLLLLVACETAGGQFPQRHTAAEASYAVTETSEILVVYIGARNCPPCFVYKAEDYPLWIASEEYPLVSYRELNFPRFQRTDEDAYWPKDLRWLREATYTRRGAPRWVVVVDGRVVSNEKSWNGRTYPLIRRLVARKSDA